ncbi:hypothetical protein D3C78_1793130 [compost metagenome]
MIQELAKFIRAGGTLQTESEILYFTRLCICIRKAVGMGDEAVALPDIAQLLFRVEVSNVQTPIKADC